MANPSHGLEVSAAPVVVEGVGLDGRSIFSAPLESRGGVLLDVFFDTPSNAFFKLRAPFITKTRNREPTVIYLFIPPERVTALNTERSDDVPQPVSEQLGTDVIRLQFQLSSPADLVVPWDDLIPKNTANGDSLHFMKSLARSTMITLYVSCLEEEQLRPLCDAISCGTVRSIGEHAELGRMYKGRGGRILTDADALISAPTSPPEAPGTVQAGPSGAPQQESTSNAGEECPPPYPPPPPPPAADSNDAGGSKKRRRPSSSADTDEDQTSALKRLVIEMFGGLGHEVRAIKEELRETKQELHETKQELHETKQELHETKQELHETKQELHETKQELGAVHDELPQIKDSCIRYVDRNIEDAKEDTDQQISDILNEADAHIGVQLDEELTTAKMELQEFITDGLRNTAADIVQRLRDAEVYLDIRFESP